MIQAAPSASALLRVILVRHGETEGDSSIRFHGATDVALSELGREQIRRARARMYGDGAELVVASSLSRAWRSAMLLAPGRPIRLEPDFREIDFGRWEGLTRDEIAARDPILYEDWQAGRPDFGFPEGEPRADFRARVMRGLERLLADGAVSAIVVAHKGVVRTLVQGLSGEEMEPSQPELGGVVHLNRWRDGVWRIGLAGA